MSLPLRFLFLVKKAVPALLQKFLSCVFIYIFVSSNLTRKMGTFSSNVSRSGMATDYWDLEKCSLFEIETSLVLELAK